MSDDTMIDASDAPAVTESFPQPEPALIRAAGYVAPPPALREPAPAGIDASGCGCSGGPAKGPVLVYALGTLGYDFGSESRRDSFAQAMPAPNNVPEDPKQLLAFLEEFPFYAQSLNWTLNLDATTIYAIVPSGPFAQMAYQFLINALRGTIDGTVLLNSIPGVIVGNAKMMSGQVVPVIEPAVRGMFSWSEPQLIASLMETGNLTEEPARAGLSNFLNRVYYDFRNLGIAGSDRALNYAASNVVQVLQVMGKLSGMELDTIVVQPSPICRPGSECYDIVLQFFTPSNTNIAAQVARFAVDVSDVIPVSVGPVRYWALR